MSDSPTLQHRPSRVVPATLTALVLLAFGVLSALVAVLRLVDGSWPAPAQAFGDFLTSTAWGSAPWIAICIGVLLLGLIMIVAALKAGRLNASRLHPPADPGQVRTELAISRRGVARLAGARADHVDGVDSVSVDASAHRVRLSVGTTSTQTDQIGQTVTQAVTDTLTRSGLHPVPRVSTSVRTKEI